MIGLQLKLWQFDYSEDNADLEGGLPATALMEGFWFDPSGLQRDCNSDENGMAVHQLHVRFGQQVRDTIVIQEFEGDATSEQTARPSARVSRVQKRAVDDIDLVRMLLMQCSVSNLTANSPESTYQCNGQLLKIITPDVLGSCFASTPVPSHGIHLSHPLPVLVDMYLARRDPEKRVSSPAESPQLARHRGNEHSHIVSRGVLSLSQCGLPRALIGTQPCSGTERPTWHVLLSCFYSSGDDGDVWRKTRLLR